jgi:hypothetical protein
MTELTKVIHELVGLFERLQFGGNPYQIVATG